MHATTSSARPGPRKQLTPIELVNRPARVVCGPLKEGAEVSDEMQLDADGHWDALVECVIDLALDFSREEDIGEAEAGSGQVDESQDDRHGKGAFSCRSRSRRGLCGTPRVCLHRMTDETDAFMSSVLFAWQRDYKTSAALLELYHCKERVSDDITAAKTEALSREAATRKSREQEQGGGVLVA